MFKRFVRKTAAVWRKTHGVLSNSKAEGYVDTGVKILIAVVLGALLLSATYALLKDNVMTSVKTRVEELFNYTDGSTGGGGSSGDNSGGLVDQPKYQLESCDDITLLEQGFDSLPYGLNISKEKLVEISVDGQAIHPGDYEMIDMDGTYFWLRMDLVKNLDLGKHTIKIVFDDGHAEGEFEVKR